jgi:non-ribosomal peptide synthetase component F
MPCVHNLYLWDYKVLVWVQQWTLQSCFLLPSSCVWLNGWHGCRNLFIVMYLHLRLARAFSSVKYSYDHGVCSKALIGETIGSHFDRQVGLHRDVDALIVRHQNVRWTYADLSLRVNFLAKKMLDLGISNGDRVGIWSPNNYEWTLTQLATAKIGAILVNINPAYQRSELNYALNLVECKALILAPALKSSNYIQILSDIAPEISQCPPGKLYEATDLSQSYIPFVM